MGNAKNRDDRKPKVWSEDRARFGAAFRISSEAHKLASLVALAQNVPISRLLNSLIIRELGPIARDCAQEFLNKE